MIHAILSCVTDQPFHISGRSSELRRFAASFLPRNQPVPLRGANGQLRFRFSAAFELTVEQSDPGRRWFEAQVCGYIVSLKDEDKGELFAYHWHPDGISRVRRPHMHVAAVLGQIDPIALGRIHLPTGMVSPTEIVRLLIEELGIAPIRPNWDVVLNAVDESYFRIR